MYVVRRLSTGEHFALKAMDARFNESKAFQGLIGRLPEVSALVKSDHLVEVVDSTLR